MSISLLGTDQDDVTLLKALNGAMALFATQLQTKQLLILDIGVINSMRLKMSLSVGQPSLYTYFKRLLDQFSSQ